jgi:hypothetical protein
MAEEIGAERYTRTRWWGRWRWVPVIPHDKQPKVVVSWRMPPAPPHWFETRRAVEVPLGVAIDGEKRGLCERINIVTG